MPYRRHISDIDETQTTIRFALVVRTEDDSETFGGGYVTLRKPITDQELDAAVQKIVDEGNNAYPRERPQEHGSAPGVTGRRVNEWARMKNLTDWPRLGQRRAR